MPTFDITSPDGKTYRVNAPEGSTKDDALKYVQQQHAAKPQTTDVATAPPGKIPEQNMGMVGSALTGLQDPLVGGKQLYTHLTGSPEESAKVDTQVQQREADLQAKGVNPIARGAGAMVPGMALAGPAGALGSVGGAMLGGAVGGAVQGALAPEGGQGNYLDQKTNDVLFSSAFGGASAGLFKGAGKVIAPTLDTAAKAMKDAGVPLTHGQIMGPIVRRAEEAFKSVPILGDFIMNAEKRGVEGFDRAYLNQGLSFIGQKLDDKVPIGRDAIAKTQDLISAEYDKLLPTLKTSLDKDLVSDLTNVRQQARELPKSQQDQFVQILNNRLAPVLAKPQATGEEMKRAVSSLRTIADGMRGDKDYAVRELAYRLDDVRGVIRDAQERQNPGSAKALQAIDSAYAIFARAQQASVRRTASEGYFMPSDLLASIKQQDRTVRKGSFARGEALTQDFAQYGQAVLPSKMPDSGTAGRYLYDGLLMAAGTAAAEGGYATNKLIGAGTGIGAGSLLYTKPALAAANALASPGPGRAAVGAGVRKAAPYLGTAAAPSALQEEKQTYQGPQQ